MKSFGNILIRIAKLLKKILGILFRYIPILLHNTILTSRPAIEAVGNIRRYRHTDYGLLVSSAAVGVVIGLFVMLFHKSVAYAEVFFAWLSTTSKDMLPVKFIIIPIIAALGGLGIGILKNTIFKGATIEGISTVVEALVKRSGRIDWRNSFKSILFAALSIGSGGGAGREGPTVVLGASLGSTFAQLVGLKPQQLRVLCGSGAAAAISGIFNAPLGGIVFAMEAIIGEISIRSFVPLVISSVLATATARILMGDEPMLIAPNLESIPLADYFFLALAGMASGFVAKYYLQSFEWSSKKIVKMVKPFPDYLKPAIGGLFAGTLAALLPTMLETTYNPINYAISGKGSELVKNSIFVFSIDFFKGKWLFVLGIIVALVSVLLKPISNALTLASGGAGGTMAPVIKTGALFGFCLGSILAYINPGTSPGVYALVCAAAVFSGTFQVPLAGGIILFEICRNYDLILPLIFSSVFASFIIQKQGIKTFNPLQKEIVDDDDKLHPKLLSKERAIF